MTYTSIKAQLMRVTDQELSKQTLLNDYISADNLTIYTLLRSVSSSGMTRHISLKFAQDNNIYDITYLAAQAMGDRVSDRNGYNTIKVSGTGMDMGFHLVYNLSSVLFHGQERAGYLLKQAWL